VYVLVWISVVRDFEQVTNCRGTGDKRRWGMMQRVSRGEKAMQILGERRGGVLSFL
jgi:hypothetical protein